MSKRAKLICATIAAAIAVVLMIGVMTHASYITAIDNAVIAVVVHHGNQTVNHIVTFITNLGNPAVVTIASIFLGILMIFRRQNRLAAFVATNMIVVNLANFIVKNIVQRPRPFVQNTGITPLVPAGGYSFPSGHSAGSVLLFGTIFILCGLMTKRTGLRRTLRTLCILLICVIGPSRIFVQVHFPTDVLAGYALGTCGLMLSWAFMAPWLAKDGLPLRLKSSLIR